jgi:transcriptional regulator with XRE-family HTH domain
MPKAVELSFTERQEFLRKYKRLIGAGMTRADIASRLGYGTPESLDAVRSGKRNPSTEKLHLMRKLVKERAPYHGSGGRRSKRTGASEPIAAAHAMVAADDASTIRDALADIRDRRQRLERFERILEAAERAIA